MSEYVEISLDRETSHKLMKLTKRQLIDRFAEMAVRLELEQKKTEKAHKEIETYKTKLDKAEAYIEQGRAMVEAVMDRWYEYDA